jgi:pantoate--beta-alanine ligase
MQRLARRWQSERIPVGFVPTMGYLHAGHLSLVKRARKEVGAHGKVVLSIYVNPTQFAPTEDLAKYPRDLQGDLRRCREAGVDVVFVPSDAEMYPQPAGEAYSTYVLEENLSRRMEGVSRPIHFRGVTTVVAKLFNLVLPRVAVFGAKDFQQATIIRRMVRDLHFPIKIIVAPTVRENDGLAKSSRNKYLSPAERPQALALSQAIQAAREQVRQAARPLPAAKLKALLTRQIQAHPAARVDYLEFFNPRTLEPASQVAPGVQMAMAVFMGKTRLIDNGLL